MTSWDGRPEIMPVGQAISRPAGILLSILVHAATIIILALSPRLVPHDQSLTAPDLAAFSENHDAHPAELVPTRSNSLRKARGNTPYRVERHLEPARFGNMQGGTQAPSASEVLGLLGNHLWQSTLCLAVAALLTLALRRNRAQVRYAIWVAASVKFLVPFWALVALGRQFGWRTPATVVAPAMTVLMDTMSQPFSRPSMVIATALPATDSYEAAAMLPLLLLAIWLGGCLVILLTWCSGWRRIAAVVRDASPIRRGYELEILRRLEARAGIRTPTTLVSSDACVEPGVFGLVKPVLLWPRGMAKRLTAGQIEAVLAHEVCHVRRRDNLIAAVHMVIEALFWFHPLIWWLETRLVDERERACDEEVVRWGHDPVVYAESILKTCEFYAESSLACVAGVTGADLEKRIEAIIGNQDRSVLSVWRKLLLATAGIVTVAVPIVVGMLSAPRLLAQVPAGPTNGPAFEAASVKPNGSGAGRGLAPQPGGRFTGTNVTTAMLIRFAYDLPDFQIFGGPKWLNSDRFDVVAKAEGDVPREQTRLMLRRLLAERFRLAAHTETRELPIYAMVMARTDGRIGYRLRRTEDDCARADRPSLDLGVGPSPSDGPPRCGFFGFAPGTDFPSGRGGLAFRGLTMGALAKIFVPLVGRSVSDQTGLAGYFDAEFDFIAEFPIPPPPPGVPSPFDTPFVSIFTVLPEQLGLKLDSRRGPVEVLVIDRVEQPTPDWK
jgi:bla regulator protein BlaR1